MHGGAAILGVVAAIQPFAEIRLRPGEEQRREFEIAAKQVSLAVCRGKERRKMKRMRTLVLSMANAMNVRKLSVVSLAAALWLWGVSAFGAGGAVASRADNAGAPAAYPSVAPAVLSNADLLPAILPDSEVVMEMSADGLMETPDWLKSLILVEVRVDSASADRTLKGMGSVLDHLAQTGVNGIWLTPINGGSHYTNHGIQTISDRLTGEATREKQFQAVKDFVTEAHNRNIRVFFDVITWGVNKNAPLLKNRPDWFGSFHEPYGGYFWKWDGNDELVEWFASQLVDWFVRTGVDGFRCDCAPNFAGYAPYAIAKDRMRRLGRKVVFISENDSDRRNVFDFDQVAFWRNNHPKDGRWIGISFLENNIVDMVVGGDEQIAPSSRIRPGSFRYYSYMLTSHDSKGYVVKGSPINIGYQALFSPYLPIWYLGEEWNNPYVTTEPHFVQTKQPHWLYSNEIDWTALDKPENRAFFELVKKMIRIRRSHPEIFEHFPDDHRDSNICKVSTGQPGLLQAYARFHSGKAVLVVPNNSDRELQFEVYIPRQAAGLHSTSPCRVTDMLSETVVAEAATESFKALIGAGQLGVYLVSCPANP